MALRFIHTALIANVLWGAQGKSICTLNRVITASILLHLTSAARRKIRFENFPIVSSIISRCPIDGVCDPRVVVNLRLIDARRPRWHLTLIDTIRCLMLVGVAIALAARVLHAHIVRVWATGGVINGRVLSLTVSAV